MKSDPFEKQIENVERLAGQVKSRLIEADSKTSNWPDQQQQIQNHVQPVLNNLLQTIQHKIKELSKFKPSRHPQLLNPTYNSLIAFPDKAPRHSQTIIFRIRILGVKIYYWFRRLLPFLIALILLVSLIIYWEEVLAVIVGLLATTSSPSQ